jgi:hypothetical protein
MSKNRRVPLLAQHRERFVEVDAQRRPVAIEWCL